MRKKKEKAGPVKKELSWTRKDPNKTDSFVSAVFQKDVFRTTAEAFVAGWREARLGRLSVIKSAVWSDEMAWDELLENLKLFIKQPPDMPVQLGFEMFTGGGIVGVFGDFGCGQGTNDGEIVLLRRRAEKR